MEQPFLFYLPVFKIQDQGECWDYYPSRGKGMGKNSSSFLNLDDQNGACLPGSGPT